MVLAAKVLFGISLEGAPKEVIISKLELLQYTIISNWKDLGEKDIDPNNIMCESILPTINGSYMGSYMSMIYSLHDGIKRVIPWHIELIPVPRSILGTNKF